MMIVTKLKMSNWTIRDMPTIAKQKDLLKSFLKS